MKVPRRRNRIYHTDRFGLPEIRAYHRKGSEKRMPRYLLKCGCCEQKLEIYTRRHKFCGMWLKNRWQNPNTSRAHMLQNLCRLIYYSDEDLEIGGVMGAIEDWREILLPLLLFERRGQRLVDGSGRGGK